MRAADVIRQAREKRGLSQKGLADLAGVSQKQVSNVEGGENTSVEFLQKIAAVLGLTEIPFETLTLRASGSETLRLGDAFQVVDPSPRFVRKHVEAYVAAGHGGWDDDIGDEWVDVPERLVGPSDFVVQARGDSMIDEGIHDGDYVLVTRVQPNIAPTGDIVIAWLNDGLVIKRWARRAGRKVLYSANAEWGEREITADDSFEIQAVVKLWWRNPKTRRAELTRVTREGAKKRRNG